jgi:hypothetical protein
MVSVVRTGGRLKEQNCFSGEITGAKVINPKTPDFSLGEDLDLRIIL